MISNVLASQETSFLKIFDNGEWGYEYVGGLSKGNLMHLKLISTGRNGNEFGGVFKRTAIEMNGNITSVTLLDNLKGSSIDNFDNNYSIGSFSNGIGFDQVDLEIVRFKNDVINFRYKYGIENRFERGYGIDIDPSGDVVACGLVGKEIGSVDNESVVIKLDTLGEEIWTRIITARYNELKARAITTDDVGNIYVLADEESLFPSIQQVALVKLSSEGDSLWTKYYPGSASLAKDIKFNQGGNLIASVTADYDGNGRSFTMMELDTSGAVIWTKSYIDEVGYAFAQHFIELQDGGYATCLDIGYPVLVVLDEDGDVANVQHYDNYGIKDPRDILELDDGSFAIAGNIIEFNQDIPKTMWLIKTNTEGELVTSTIEEAYPEFTLYPNPTHDWVQIKGLDYTSAMLLNTMGQIVSSYTGTQRIDLSDLRSGSYYLVLQTKKGSFTKRIVKGN